MKKALIFYGGWAGHEPRAVAERTAATLSDNGFSVELCEGVDCLLDREVLLTYDLIVPTLTMGKLPKECEDNIVFAVSEGVGLAGCHGGMCDAFRDSPTWQFMTGAQWVAHPGGDGVNYTVNILGGSSPIVDGIEDFDVCSEQYYLHIDPAVKVLATTDFTLGGERVTMPVAFTKKWGKGRVFYSSLGHNDAFFDLHPSATLLFERGLLFAARD